MKGTWELLYIFVNFKSISKLRKKVPQESIFLLLKIDKAFSYLFSFLITLVTVTKSKSLRLMLNIYLF